MSDDTVKSLDEFRTYLAEIINLDKDNNGDSSKIAYLKEMLENYLVGITSEWEDDPSYYQDERIQASHHSEDWDKLDLLISEYHGVNINPQSQAYATSNQLRKRFQMAINFVLLSLDGGYEDIDESDELRALSKEIYMHNQVLENIRFILITDKPCYSPDESDSAELPSEKLDGHIIDYQIWTLEKVHALDTSINESEGNIEIDLLKTYGEMIPCIKVDFEDSNLEYESYIGYLKGDLLARLYRDYNTKLLEGNIRVFLQTTTPANKGIMKTLSNPDHPNERTRFFAYNNGISATADSVVLHEDDSNGIKMIEKIRGLQIVNGGQTTASIYTAWKKNQKNISGVYLQMKLTTPNDGFDRNDLNTKISIYSNTQNQIRLADFDSNKPIQIALERLSRSVLIPGKEFGWYYERTRGQYNEQSRLYELKGKREQKQELAFDKRFPKSRKITKTDLAIHYNTWHNMPYFAVRGGERNFQKFKDYVIKQYPDIRPEVIGECPADKYVRFYRELIATSILFIATDQLVMDWQKGNSKYGKSSFGSGFKRETVVYTLALLSYLTNWKLSLESLWDYQVTHGVMKKTIRLPEELEHLIITIVPFVEKELRNVPTDRNDPREWAKTEGAWNTFKERFDAKMIQLPNDVLQKYCLSDEEMAERKAWLDSISRHQEQSTIDPSFGTDVTDDSKPNNRPKDVNLPKTETDVTSEEKIRQLLTKASIMELSKIISDFQKIGILSDDDLKLFQKAMTFRRAHQLVPEKLVGDIIASMSGKFT